MSDPRSIKFRVWNGSRYYYTRSGAAGFSTGTAPSLNFFWTDPDGFNMSLLGDGAMIVEQFTGLLDAKGSEIYEGDILSGGGGYKHIVVSIGEFEDTGISSFSTYKVDGYGVRYSPGESVFYSFTRSFIKNCNLVITGNIHSSPEPT